MRTLYSLVAVFYHILAFRHAVVPVYLSSGLLEALAAGLIHTVAIRKHGPQELPDMFRVMDCCTASALLRCALLSSAWVHIHSAERTDQSATTLTVIL